MKLKEDMPLPAAKIENDTSSEFVTPGSSGTTSNAVTSSVMVDGKMFFKKQLSPTHRGDLRHRMAMYKEFETGQKISSRYIVKYHTISEDEHGLYVLMENVNGHTLAEKVESEPKYFLNAANIEKFLLQLLEALKVIHHQNIAYLDLKPENIMLTQISNDVKLIDLGGCFTDSNNYTAERTKAFAAPELINGNIEEIDARTDIYAVGKMMEYIEEKCGKKLSPRLQNIKKRCLNEDKTMRYPTASDMIKALKNRKKWIKIWLAAAAITIAAVFGWQWFATTEAHRQLRLYMESDKMFENIYYKITPENDLTCSVIGHRQTPNLYIASQVTIDSKKYTVTDIGSTAFRGHEDVASVNIPATIKSIGSKAFEGCTGIANISMPDNTSKVGDKCFRETGIKSVRISKNIKEIKHGSFSRCYKLEEVTIPEGVETIGLDAFADCFALKSVKLPSSLETIARGAFWHCKSIKEIRIPEGVENIGEYAFFNCDSMEHVYNYAKIPQRVSRIFNRKVTVHVPAESAEEYKEAYHWKDLKIIGDLN